MSCAHYFHWNHLCIQNAVCEQYAFHLKGSLPRMCICTLCNRTIGTTRHNEHQVSSKTEIAGSRAVYIARIKDHCFKAHEWKGLGNTTTSAKCTDIFASPARYSISWRNNYIAYIKQGKILLSYRYRCLPPRRSAILSLVCRHPLLPSARAMAKRCGRNFNIAAPMSGRQWFGEARAETKGSKGWVYLLKLQGK